MVAAFKAAVRGTHGADDADTGEYRVEGSSGSAINPLSANHDYSRKCFVPN